MAQQALANDVVIRRLGPALGAEVLGLDLAQPLDEAGLARIRAALQQHHVLCFRDQALTGEQQIAFSERFGPLESFPEKDKTKAETTLYHVANTSAEGEHLPENDPRVIFQKINARWHTDSSYRYTPSFLSLLYGIEVMPDGAVGGETEFSNMVLAYDALPAALKRRIEPLHMVHYYEFGRRLFPELPPVSQVEREFVPPVSHPLVRVHPDRDGRRSLFITTNAGNEISGMSLEDGQALHRSLAEHVSQDAFCYRHRWRRGDLVVWDNRCLLHRARAYDMARYRRVFRRTTVAGSFPVLGPYSDAARG
jgi:taurine dioxygenase/alpha-ketoglutarate-dependent 2,4-dichlorophenoxyacetate dioxygenase